MRTQPGRIIHLGQALALTLCILTPGLAGLTQAAEPVKEIRVGIIGLDTSHAGAFAKELNNPKASEDVAHCKIVAAYPKGSPDIKSSVERVPQYTKDMHSLGVEIVDSIDTLLTKVDAILLETNDGRPHFEQALPVFKAKKPMFIDKPVAGSLSDAIALFMVAEKTGVPMFSSSSLRFTPGAQQIRDGKIGKVLGCDAYSPCHLEKTHPDFFWYGVHGVESLFTCMGSGCQSVSRTSAADFELAVGVWDEGRVGTFRGIHAGKQTYGGTAFGEKGLMQLGDYGGYRPLVVEIVKFFRTGVAPVSPAETIEIFAFMEAADESKRQGGKPVTIESVMSKARTEAQARVSQAGF
ncbi:MAG: Gfo/Idh/MocA family oxidoreductase [Planctomycetales bacterium]